MTEGEFQKQLNKYHETGKMTVELAVKLLSECTTNGVYDDETEEAKFMAIKALEQEPILDKIRDEIETEYGQCDVCEYFEDYDYEENDVSEYRPIGSIADILQIIDKYKAESEPRETETWNGIHAQITAPKGTFDKIWEDAESDDAE